MKWRAVGLAVLVSLALAACSGIRVQSDWDPEVDFSQFQTFTFLANAEPALNSLVDRRIRAAIGDQLSAEGLREVDSLEDADLAIGYPVAMEQRHPEPRAEPQPHHRCGRADHAGLPAGVLTLDAASPRVVIARPDPTTRPEAARSTSAGMRPTWPAARGRPRAGAT